MNLFTFRMWLSEVIRPSVDNSPLVKHAEYELSLLPDQDDPLNKMMSRHLIGMVRESHAKHTREQARGMQSGH